MKKEAGAAALTLVMLLSGCASSGTQQKTAAQNNEVRTEAPTEKTEAKTETAGEGLSQEEAMKIALDDAGVREDEVTFTKTGTDMDHGVRKYEFDFYTADAEYEYDIDAVSGEILSRSKEIFKGTGTEAAGGNITEDAALQTALKHAGVGEDEISRVKIEYDFDDGREKYEVEFNVGRTEYSYDIDAATGEILGWEKDDD